MRFSTLDEWLCWQESLHSSEIDMGLGRVREVARRLDLLMPKHKVVTVAGTNGKGSCVTSLQGLLNASGVRVASYTSPHLLRYNERIRIDGKPVDDALICQAFDRIDQARCDAELSEISLTYFEFGTLAAIEVAAQLAVDVLVLEVGLGGRLDAVNILDADVAVVTSIAQDHEAWLGTDINVIGREKAGVFRAGRPAICASVDVPPTVAEVAAELGAEFIAAGEALKFEALDGVWHWQGLDAEGGAVAFDRLPLPNLPLSSVAAALQAFYCLSHSLTQTHIQLLGALAMPGRTQVVVRDGVSFTLDVGHNPAAAEYLSAHLKASGSPDQATYFVIAMMADKDAQEVLSSLVPMAAGVFFADLPGNPRAASASELQAALASKGDGQGASAHATVALAMAAAQQQAVTGDRIVVMGSFFTVAEALSYLGLE